MASIEPEEEETPREKPGEEGVGPRFKKGSEDLDQLEGIEKQQGRSRRAKREPEHEDTGEDPDPDEVYPAIDDIENSRQRLKNRLKGIRNYEDASDDFND